MGVCITLTLAFIQPNTWFISTVDLFFLDGPDIVFKVHIVHTLHIVIVHLF